MCGQPLCGLYRRRRYAALFSKVDITALGQKIPPRHWTRFYAHPPSLASVKTMWRNWRETQGRPNDDSYRLALAARAFNVDAMLAGMSSRQMAEWRFLASGTVWGLPGGLAFCLSVGDARQHVSNKRYGASGDRKSL